MRFLIGESADARVATHLASLGHDVTTLAARIARLSDVLSKYSDQLDRFLVVTPQSVRARHVP
jgi:ABC-type transporter Mla subunit MlaD